MSCPPLPLDAVEGLEPVLRVRHAITNTNYYVEVYTPVGAEQPSASSRPHLQIANSDAQDPPATVPAVPQDDALLEAIPAAKNDLYWTPATRLTELPLTGLARKVLQRLRVMRVETPELK